MRPGWRRTGTRYAQVTLIVLAMAGAARAGDDRGRTLVVGSEVDFPPFATGRTDETAGGFTVELWTAVAAEQGLEFRLRVRPFGQLLDEFKAGEVDVMINLAQSDQRRTFADFSVPHVVVRGAIFVRTDGSPVHSEADLAGKSLVVIHADLAHDYALTRGWGPQLVLVDDAAEGLRLLASGRHDAMLLSKLAGLQTLQRLELRNVKALAAQPGFAQKFSFAVRKGDFELLARINEGLAVAKSTGVYDRLYERWFGVLEPKPDATLRTLLKYLAPIGAALVILLGVFLVKERERKKGERRLRLSEERLRMAIAAGRQGLYDVDYRSGQCMVSAAYATMLGYDPAEFRETLAAWRERTHPDDRATVDAAHADHAAGRRTEYLVEYRQRARDGRWIWVQSLGSLTKRGADGQPLRLVGTHTDITVRKLAEEARDQSEVRFRTLTESAPVLIYLTDAAGACVYVNRRWCEATGLTPAQAAGQGWLAGVHDDDRTAVAEGWGRAVASGSAWAMEYRFRNPGGVVTCVYGTAAPIREASGVIVGYVGTNTDITALRQAAIEREGLDRKLQETQKLESLGVLTGGIAHDFNNLLGTILANASIVTAELPPGSAVHDCIDQINAASRRAADLCMQMLAYSGRGRFVVETLDLGQLVAQTAQMLQISISKKAILTLHLAKGLPPSEVDATQVRQVIMNLVINASEAIGDASGTIDVSSRLVRVGRDHAPRTWVESAPPDGDYVALTVTDSGGGMSAETQARIFEPFFTTKFTGRRLGLAAVLGIVRGHRGAVRMASELGRGTTFELLFPVVADVSEPAAARPAVGGAWRGHGTVLVVDDEETMRRAVARMMRLIGFEPVVAADGHEAVEIFNAQPDRFALVLLDLTMPGLDGKQTLAELRRVRPDVCVVLMSGFHAQDVLTGFAGKQPTRFLQKPFNLDALTATMRAALDQDGR